MKEGKGCWDGMPLGLSASVDIAQVVKDARKVANAECDNVAQKSGDGENKTKKKVDVVSHFEAGWYGCGFVYYESLATCLKRGLSTKVVFCHIPGWRDEESLERGADVVSAVIGSICNQIPRVTGVQR